MPGRDSGSADPSCTRTGLAALCLAVVVTLWVRPLVHRHAYHDFGVLDWMPGFLLALAISCMDLRGRWDWVRWLLFLMLMVLDRTLDLHGIAPRHVVAVVAGIAAGRVLVRTQARRRESAVIRAGKYTFDLDRHAR